jgi:arsenite-transporting ATPase
VLPLPAALARAVVAGARLDNGRLQVRFAPREPLAGTTAQELAQGIREQYDAEPEPAGITEGTR